MRIIATIGTVCLGLATSRQFVSAHDGEDHDHEAATQEGDDEWDDWEAEDVPTGGDDDFDTEAEPESMEEDTTLAEASDADMSHDERKVRMSVCINVARQKFAALREELKPMLEAMQEMHGMDENQAVEMVHINMIKNCYINLDQKEDLAVLVGSMDGNIEQWEIVVNRLIAPPANAPAGKRLTLAERQWSIIKEVVEAEREEKESPSSSKSSSSSGKKEQKQQQKTPRIEVIGEGMNWFQKLLYFVSVFGLIFGGGYLLVKKLIQMEASKKVKKEKKQRKISPEPSAAVVPASSSTPASPVKESKKDS